jgi:hypothetical protein
MKAKLIKENNFYKLIQDNTILVKISINESIDIHYSFGKLSLSNCKAIELGYDLENMADFYGAKAKGSVDFKLGVNQGFEEGFQKALSILGDKKFSDKDLLHIWNYSNLYYQGEKEYTFLNAIQSLQQTEWDVEIEMRSKNIDELRESNEGFLNNTNLYIPKLDEDGCIILKRKS